MREIKLRVWDSRNKLMLSPDKSVDNNLSTPCCDFNYDCAEYLQYTGLKDCNGVEVYEGDVVEWLDFAKYKYRNLVKNKFKIVWQPKKCGFGMKNFIDIVPILGIQSSKKMKILGNIYENPELLIEK